MKPIYRFLDNAPVGTLIALGAVVGGIVALINGDITFQELLIGLGASSAGAGVIGEARNRAGKGVRE